MLPRHSIHIALGTFGSEGPQLERKSMSGERSEDAKENVNVAGEKDSGKLETQCVQFA